MELPSDILLVFDRDEDLFGFESPVHAMNWLEAIDVDDGEYPATYSPDGGVWALTAPEGPEGPVVLARTGRVDKDDLERRVARYWQRHHQGRAPRDPVETARSLIEANSKPRRVRLGRITPLLQRGTAGMAAHSPWRRRS